MFAGALVIMFLGVYTAECTDISIVDGQENATIFNNTLEVLRSGASLRLLRYSAALENETSKCLISRFLNTTTDGAQRTLETNVKFSVPSGPNRTNIHSRTNITITLEAGENPPRFFPRLVLSDDSADLLPNDWMYPVWVVHADTKCFVLSVPFNSGEKNPCVLWGSATEDNCLDAFQKSCMDGKMVDMKQCDGVEEANEAHQSDEY